MADIADQAQQAEALNLSEALRRHRAQQPRGDGSMACEACDDEIPEERRMARPGCRLCVDCQGDFERGMGR